VLFNSYIFVLLFMPVVVAGYFLAGSRMQRQLSIAWLVAASLFFYAWWNPIYLVLIVGSALFNFAIGRQLGQRAESGARYALPLLVTGITTNLLLLGYFKYANFFVDNVNALTGSSFELAPIFLPLAISFFTFQQISYLVDAYKQETRDYNFLHYMLFVTFFPQLIAGPIVHHSEMMPQFDDDETYKLKRRNIELGLSIFSVGLFKKVILADNIALFSTPVFQAADAGATLSMAESWFGATAFGLQVYFDFSGYSDMAIGAARIFGVKLPINFYSPYKALNIPELWRRWHMTLTRLITAYIYMPLSINQARRAIVGGAGETRVFWQSVAYPAMVTFVLVGLWHGAGWNYVIFGAFQGVFMIANNLWRDFRKQRLGHKLKESTLAGRVAARGLTAACFIFSLTYFKAATTTGAVTMTSAMLGFDGIALNTDYISAKDFVLYATLYFAIIFLLPNTQQLFGKFEPSLEPEHREPLTWLESIRWKPDVIWALVCAAMFVAALLSMSKVSEFIYFQF